LAEFRWRVDQNIKNNSDMFHITKDPLFQEWLRKTNNYYRAKLKDIETEENKQK